MPLRGPIASRARRDHGQSDEVASSCRVQQKQKEVLVVPGRRNELRVSQLKMSGRHCQRQAGSARIPRSCRSTGNDDPSSGCRSCLCSVSEYSSSQVAVQSKSGCVFLFVPFLGLQRGQKHTHHFWGSFILRQTHMLLWEDSPRSVES